VQGPDAPHWVTRGVRTRRNVLAPLRREVLALLAFDHAPVADERALLDAQPRFALVALCRQGLRRWRLAGKDFEFKEKSQ